MPPVTSRSAVAGLGRRDRTVAIAVLIALAAFFVYRYLHARSDDDGDTNADIEARRSSVAAPVAYGATADSPLKTRAADDVRAAAEKYDTEYRDRMAKMMAPKEEEKARTFLGFSVADNITPGVLVVDGVFEKGPAFQVGVDIDHELVAIAGQPATDVDTVRGLVAQHCKPGHVTRFTFRDDATGAKYDAQVWVMTADVKFRGKPYFFAADEHEARTSDRLKQTWRPDQSPKKGNR